MNHLLAAARSRPRDQVERSKQGSFSATAAVCFARAVLGMGPTILDCDVCQAAVPEYIETELDNRPDLVYCWARHHIDLSIACSGVYLELVDVALLAKEDSPPGPSRPVDLSFVEPPSGRSSPYV